MKSKSTRIEPLRQRASEHEHGVARELAQKTGVLGQNEQRLQELQHYAEEYARWRDGVAISPAQIANREAFRDRIRGAIGTQVKSVEQCRINVEFERARLLLARRETKVFEQLQSNYRAEEARIDRMREQKALDEFAIRTHPRRDDEPEDAS